MAIHGIIPENRITDNSDNPVASGQLHVFLAGTTTYASIYSDEALTNAVANPLIADAGGFIDPFFTNVEKLKLRKTLANGTTVVGIEVDNVDPKPPLSIDDLTDTPVNKTGSALKYLQINSAETAVDYVSITGTGNPYWVDLTGVGDGTTDDGPALVAQAEAARAAGKGLRGDASKEYYIGSTTGLTFNTAGTYDWLNIRLKGNPSLATSTPMILFDGPSWATDVSIQANLARGTSEILINNADNTNFTVGEAFVVRAATAFHTNSATGGNKSEWTRVKQVEPNTGGSAINSTNGLHSTATSIPAGQTLITIEGNLLYSYLQASPDSTVLKYYAPTMSVKLRGCDASITGNVATDLTTGFRFNRCASVNVDDQDVSGFPRECYRVEETIDAWFGRIGCKDALGAGLGYGINPPGCFHIHCERMVASNIRHFIPFGGGGPTRIMLKHGSFGTLIGSGMLSAGFDVHPGAHFVTGDSVQISGVDLTETMCTIQSGNVSINSIVTTGGHGNGLLVQGFGGPLGEYNPHVEIGLLDGGYNINSQAATDDTSKTLIFVENLDTTNLTKQTVHVGTAKGNWGGTAVLANSAASGGSNGGDVTIIVDNLFGTFRKGKIIYCNNDNPQYTNFIKIGHIDVLGTDVNSYAAYADQTVTVGTLPGIGAIAATSGTNVLTTSDTDVFTPAMVGSEITETGAGVGKIIRYIDSKTIRVDITTAFSATTGLTFNIDRKGNGSVIDLGTGLVNVPNTTVSVFRTVSSKIYVGDELRHQGFFSVIKNESGDGGVYFKGASKGGLVSSTGSVTESNTITASKTATGTYQITFVEDEPDTEYQVTTQMTSRGFATSTSRTKTGYIVNTYSTSDVAADRTFSTSIRRYK